MGDFSGSFKESFGKSLAYGTGGIIFLLVLGMLAAAGFLTIGAFSSR
jgi:hypothetical protein